MKKRFLILLVSNLLTGMDLIINLETEYRPMLGQQELFEQESVHSLNQIARCSELRLIHSLQEYITGIITCLDPECNFLSTNVQFMLNHLRDMDAHPENMTQELAFSFICGIYGNQKYACLFCNDLYTTLPFLTTHLVYEHLNLLKKTEDHTHQSDAYTTKPSVIPPWKFTFTRSKKGKFKDKICIHCNKEFSRKELELHLKRKHIRPEEQELFFCDIDGCDHTYTTKPSLALHITRSHKEKLYICEQCDKAYALPGDLKWHNARIHKKTPQ